MLHLAGIGRGRVQVGCSRWQLQGVRLCVVGLLHRVRQRSARVGRWLCHNTGQPLRTAVGMAVGNVVSMVLGIIMAAIKIASMFAGASWRDVGC